MEENSDGDRLYTSWSSSAERMIVKNPVTLFIYVKNNSQYILFRPSDRL